MSLLFEELDFQQTPLGELMLRRRSSPSLGGRSVYEVKLNDEFLMSSVVTRSEEALATLALAAQSGRACDVLVGGLGLGYTAAAVLRSERVQRVTVMEYLEPVLDWHTRRLLPVSDTLLDDPRCELVHGDFFRRIADGETNADPRHDVILLDIDHSPESWLHASHELFYSFEGLKRLAASLTPQGVFGLWSAEPSSPAFLERLQHAFTRVEQHPVRYDHPMLHREETNIVVIAGQA